VTRGVPLLVFLGALVVAAVVFQRARSPFLQIEAERDLAERVAAQAAEDLEVVDVLALRELLGVDRGELELQVAARAFSTFRARFDGSELLAILAVTSELARVEDVLRRTGGDVGEAEALVRLWPDAVAATRFARMRERFVAREPTDR
jgi:hypothetical protein